MVSMFREWMMADWEVSFPGTENDALRADLLFHLNAMLGQPMQEIALNGPLVEQVQGILVQMPSPSASTTASSIPPLPFRCRSSG